MQGLQGKLLPGLQPGSMSGVPALQCGLPVSNPHLSPARDQRGGDIGWCSRAHHWCFRAHHWCFRAHLCASTRTKAAANLAKYLRLVGETSVHGKNTNGPTARKLCRRNAFFSGCRLLRHQVLGETTTMAHIRPWTFDFWLQESRRGAEAGGITNDREGSSTAKCKDRHFCCQPLRLDIVL